MHFIFQAELISSLALRLSVAGVEVGACGLLGAICFLPPVHFGQLPALPLVLLFPASDVGVVNTLYVTPVCEGRLYPLSYPASVQCCPAFILPGTPKAQPDVISLHCNVVVCLVLSVSSPLPLPSSCSPLTASLLFSHLCGLGGREDGNLSPL